MRRFSIVISLCVLVFLLIISGCQTTNSDLNENWKHSNTVESIEVRNDVSGEVEELSTFFKKVHASELDKYEAELYSATVSTVLSQNLWYSRDIYDTAHLLMVPLWYAFESGNEKYIEEFSNHYKRFVSYLESNESEFAENSKMQKNHYLYLASEFIMLCELYDYNDYIPEGLYEHIENYVIDYYYNYKAAWGRAIGIPEILDKILSGEEIFVKNITKTFYRAITDLETFPLAIMANLYTIQKNSGLLNEHTQTYKKAMEYTYRIFKTEVVWNSDGGWNLQPGVWAEHPDYAYAGVEKVDENTRKSLVENITWDSSHYQRFAVFLNSFMRAQDTAERARYFSELIEGLSVQFLEFVLVRPEEKIPFYRITNYMDGSNGFYRYGYHEDGVGYGPYQHSKTLLYGWWTFLRNEEISNIYSDIVKQFPLDGYGKKVYYDPVTIRERNKLFTSWEILELLCILSSKI